MPLCDTKVSYKVCLAYKFDSVNIIGGFWENSAVAILEKKYGEYSR